MGRLLFVLAICFAASDATEQMTRLRQENDELKHKVKVRDEAIKQQAQVISQAPPHIKRAIQGIVEQEQTIKGLWVPATPAFKRAEAQVAALSAQMGMLGGA